MDHHRHAPIAHDPRAVLKAQVARAEALGFDPIMATELEFFLFAQSYDEIRQADFRNLQPISGYNEDYHIFQTTKEEHIMRPIRNHLVAMGVPVEGSKGEAEAGQEELNIRYAHALATADHHCLAKHAIKEIAWTKGHAATFMPKWDHRRVGSSAHVHMSLWREGENAFCDLSRDLGMSQLMEHFVAGLIAYTPDITAFLAPYVNSYKRFATASFAPTKTVWSVDNRTVAYRLCAPDSKAVRIECRIGGADMNPYLGLAALLAAGLAGIEERLVCPPAAQGDQYAANQAGDVPKTLRDATKALDHSDVMRGALGDDVVDHYVRAASWEQEAFDQIVTDWEIARGFERA